MTEKIVANSDGYPSLFVLGSCQYPPDIVRQRAAYRTIDKLQEIARLEGKMNQTYMTVLIAGDSIYADATAGLFDPVEEVDRYLNAYRKFLHSPQKRYLDNPGEPTAYIYSIDDHEIDDNWEPPASREQMLLAKHYFINKENTLVENPVQMTKEERAAYLLELEDTPLWSHRSLGAAELFVMDTRTERQGRTASNLSSAKMYSDKQSCGIENWLSELHKQDLANTQRNPSLKFVLSGSMILPRHLYCANADSDQGVGLLSDSWDGFPASRDSLLAYIAVNDIKNVIFLSGDEHIPCVATITLLCCGNNSSTTVYSLHAAPFYAPLPFANGRPPDFPGLDQFDFRCSGSGAQISAVVKSDFAEIGNGYMMFRMPSDFTGGSLSVEFHGDRGYQEYSLCLSN